MHPCQALQELNSQSRARAAELREQAYSRLNHAANAYPDTQSLDGFVTELLADYSVVGGNVPPLEKVVRLARHYADRDLDRAAMGND